MEYRARVPFLHRRRQNTTTDDGGSTLLFGLRNGCEDCYRELLLLIHRLATPLSYSIAPGPYDRDDLVQNVALKVFLRLRDFRGECSLQTWIYRIATNELHNCKRWLLRHHCREVTTLDAAPNLPRDCITSNVGSCPFSLAAERQENEQVATALMALSPTCRDAIRLRVVDELTYNEIAEHLGISVVTVKSRIFSARQQLRSDFHCPTSLRRPLKHSSPRTPLQHKAP